METSTAYQDYISAMQNYQTPQGRENYQTPYAEAFETIYNQAKDAEVDEAKHVLPVPITMNAEMRDAYISALNGLSTEERLTAMMLTFDVGRINANINNTPYTPPTIDYNYLKTQVENLLNPKGGGFTSQQTKATITKFWDAFNAAYSGDKNRTTEETDSEITQFLHDLRTKGAAKFLADLNQEKIDKLVEEYREKLIAQMGDSPEAMEKIEKMVEEFKKQLIEEMMEKMQEEKKTKQEVVFMSPETTMLAILDSQQEKKKPLETLLQS